MDYDLKSVHAPRLAGATLKTLATLLENGYTHRFLQQPLLREAGLETLRETPLSAPITSMPLHLNSRAVPLNLAEESRKPLDSGELPEPFTDTEFKPVTAAALAHAYREARTNPVTVAEKVIAGIEATGAGDTPLNAFICSQADNILRQARESLARLKDGNPRSQLEGVPVAIKDELDALPYSTSVGTRFLGKDGSCRDDATVVARLRAAGAVIIGKTNMHEIGLGVTGNNPHWGVCRNPYNPRHHSGGSSSGSAAAVAAGLCPIAVGADGGGSIRIPAALCGVTGLKATWGRISESGAAPLCWSVAHNGPIGTCVDDVALAYMTMAGPDINDRWTLSQPTAHLRDYLKDDLRGLRVGIYSPWFRHASDDVVDVCESAVRVLLERGATRHEFEIEHLNLQRVAHAVTIVSEMLASMNGYYPGKRTHFSLETRVSLALGSQFTARDYVRAQQVRTLAIQSFMRALSDVDILLMPTTAITAPPIHASAVAQGESDLHTLTELMRFATAANLTGLPALTVPAGYDRHGLPVGLQLMGRPWEEHVLLRVGRTLEQHAPREKPAVYVNLLD
ncbi:amidase [Mangrovitalea sediminis]|uniref:amidase n=1 Tax=Mangrovitalea sediminis TaxID=1982043 RepID=UPI000BE5A161|nr:amidase [Mangrovitalea sediminis]